MCQRVQCSSCGRPTFKGCGRHVEQVLGQVPLDQRCRCREESRKPQATGGPARPGAKSWLRNLLGG